MNSPPGIPLYNQDRLSDQDFVDNFVARGELVEALLNDLRAQAERGESRHTLIVGPRGMGKSSLLRRIAIGVSTDQRLRETFIPLRFREEQYNVITLDAFWRNCGEALAEWSENDGRGELATRLDEAIASPPWRDAEQAAAAFMAACGEIGRRAILLIDNLDIVLDALAERECWALRNTLQRKGGPIIFGAATSLLRQGGDSRAPFYEFFFPHVLEPLSETELLRCMRALAEKRGEPGMAVTVILTREPQRARALFALTGGNPRVLALIYQLLERAESQEILADLETLLDGVTPYYKARVEEYGASQQRAIIDAIALNWDPMTSNAIGQVTGVEVTTISSQLSKLKKDGFVEEVSTSGARAGYQISERFLNIWYLMRHGTRRVRQRLRWLTLFLTKLFSPEELGRMLEEADGEKGVGRWRADWRIAVREAYELACAPLAPRDSYQEDLSIALDVASQSSSGAESSTTKVSLEIDLEGLRTSSDTIADLFESGKYSEALAICDDILMRFGDSREPAFQAAVAGALVYQGVTLGALGRSQDAIDVYNDLVARFGEATETPLREEVANALFNKAARLGALGRSQDAIDVYDVLVARFGEATETPLRERVANALFNKGARLGALGRSQDEIEVYDDLVALFGEATEAPLRALVSSALFNKGFSLGALGRSQDAIDVYDDLVARFSGATETSLREQVAGALLNKGVTLGALGRSQDAIDVYDDLVARFGEATETPLREQVANALFNKGVRLGKLGRSQDAVDVYDDLVARFGEATETPLPEQVARALFNKGVTLGALGRSQDEIEVYDDLVARFGEATEAPLREQVPGALFNKGFRLGALGRSQDAIDVYDDLVARFGEATETPLRERVANALFNKGVTLGALGRSQDEIDVYDDLVARFGDATEAPLREQVARALFNKGCVLLDQLGDATGAEACYRQALTFEDQSIMTKGNLAWAVLAAGRIADSEALRADLADLDASGLALLDAGIEFAKDNFGLAVDLLGRVLKDGLEDGASPFFEDLLRVLRLAEAKGYGERLIAWFETTGQADRYAPVFAALVAFVRGERFLLDVNPEVRAPARKLFDQLAAPRKYAAPKAAEPARRGRGRPRKEGGARR